MTFWIISTPKEAQRLGFWQYLDPKQKLALLTRTGELHIIFQGQGRLPVLDFKFYDLEEKGGEEDEKTERS